ncbi:MAG: lactate utilization protein [Candidatus Rokubacteria bacterium]|nr:lactate utilization protein [Candidatus Rokubacteria bacterium]
MEAGTAKNVETLIETLKGNRFSPVEFVGDRGAAADLVLGMIPLEATVGAPGSTTVRQLGIVARLRERGTAVVDPLVPSDLPVEEVHRQSLRADVLLASSNALTLDGKLVNIDGVGNRVGGMIFGPRKVILVIGTNKIVRDVNEALDRIKNVIAPYHARTKGRRTPCATKGYCTDCRSPERMCNVTTIIEKKPRLTDVAIVLVGEDLGLAWQPDWPEARRERIAAAYRETRIGYRSGL